MPEHGRERHALDFEAQRDHLVQVPLGAQGGPHVEVVDELHELEAGTIRSDRAQDLGQEARFEGLPATAVRILLLRFGLIVEVAAAIEPLMILWVMLDPPENFVEGRVSAGGPISDSC